MSEPSTTASTTTPEQGFLESGRHPVNIAHLVMGIAFVGLALVWGLHQGDLTENDALRWLLPVPWVLAGAAGLVATAVASHRRHSTRQTGWVDATEES
ncbi:MAG: hypothetical protein Q8O61_20200 [Nocardioides sp.]|nr:hypothetical protein [Nocardioides sp.]